MKKFYDEINGEPIYLYTISDGDIEVDISEFGAQINSIRVKGVDIVLGFNSIKDYLNSKSNAGATIGRVANRIAKGRFTLNGKEFSLNTNNGTNHLHGGNVGFNKKLFKVLYYSQTAVSMQYVSPDGEENYPGNFTFNVTFTLKGSSLIIDFEAFSDKDTLWNPTNHAYFNLDGESIGDCRENILQINADYYTPTDGELIPTGEKRAVKGTPFDFNIAKPIGEDFGKVELQATNGYDHNYLLNGAFAAHAEGVKTGVKMDVYTDMPCMQLYTGGKLNGCNGKTINYNQWAGFCLEPQYCPNAINMDSFDKPVLNKNELKKHYIKFVIRCANNETN